MYFSQRAILASRSDNVAKVNTTVLNMFLGETYEYLAADKFDDEEGTNVALTKF